jgi:hypothetical protein
MKKTTVLMAAVLVVAVATTALATDSAFATNGQGKSQTSSQTNDCGNGTGPDGILCETLSSEIWGDDNVVNIFGED